MAKKKNGKNGSRRDDKKNGDRTGRHSEEREPRLHHEVKKSIWALIFFGFALILILARFHRAGPAGEFFFRMLNGLFGVGYFLLPGILVILGVVFLASERRRIYASTFAGALLFILSGLGLLDIIIPQSAGYIGRFAGLLQVPFGPLAGGVLMVVITLISIVLTLNLRLKLPQFNRQGEEGIDEVADEEIDIILPREAPGKKIEPEDEGEDDAAIPDEEEILEVKKPVGSGKIFAKRFKNYVPPPLDLLKSSVEKPTSGDLRANANIIKRTLESFGILVEMGEINIGPKVTRYTLKPAEGVKLARLTALNSDLSLALAAHPIRIEAPIPGKSLVGIEVPNKSAAVVRLGSLMAYPEFSQGGSLSFVLGRDVNGDPQFADIARMPHLLIAGSTGSGKSVSIHALITSLLYKNSPETLRFVLIDPKRVELSLYSNLPHLVSPVITEPKKAVGVFRWAISEMDRRYELLVKAGSRDIQSFNKNKPEESLPYVAIVVDELADLMSTYGREVEGSIVRLAQMARATGIHLILSTQRPSVEVVTGLIKANITTRIALQLPSQIDSRTILDSSGAEKLLGGGDMLFVSSEFSKPRRIQGAYLSEDEVKKVTDFIRENNAALEAEELVLENGEREGPLAPLSDEALSEYSADGDDDSLLDEAVRVVREANKASASLLQRRLKVGYARAARLLDIMEERGIVGPGEGAKPREVFTGTDD